MFFKSLKNAVTAFFSQEKALETVVETQEDRMPEEVFFPLFDRFSDLLPQPPYSYHALTTYLNKRKASFNKEEIPDYVVDYVSMNVLIPSVLRIFYESKGWVCHSLDELKPLVAENPQEASEILYTIRICDPKCFTGQFLKSALNQLLAIKSELGLLKLDSGEAVDLFDTGNIKIQKYLLSVKQAFIKNSLFGADNSQEAVDICQLRLLLEQLKHAEVLLKNGEEIPTPVACHVVCGDSLVYRVPIDTGDLKSVFKKTGTTISRYKRLLGKYKAAITMADKEQLEWYINELRLTLQKEMLGYEKNNDEILKLQKEYNRLTAPTLFERSPEEEEWVQKRMLEINEQLELCRQKQDKLNESNDAVVPVEWRIDFPELWDDEGVFWGFDVMLGLLPDMSMHKMADVYPVYEKMNYATLSQTGYVSSLYYELAARLLKPEYYLSFFSTNRWMEQVVVSELSQVFKAPMAPQTIMRFSNRYFGKNIHAAYSIWLIKKTSELTEILSCDIGPDCGKSMKGLKHYIETNAFPYLPVGPNARDASEKPNDELRDRVKKIGKPLRDWDLRFYEGIVTGCNQAFIINQEQREQLLAEGYKYGDIMKPIVYGKDISRYTYKTSGDYLLYIPWHFPLHFDVTITSASEKAEPRFNQQYPAVYEHLLHHADSLKRRDPLVGKKYEWYTLTYHGEHPWDDHSAEQKVACAKLSADPTFCLDYAGSALLNDCCFISGQHLKYILAVLNSKLGVYMLYELEPNDAGLREVTVDFLASFVMPVPDARIESEIGSLINRLTGKVFGIEREIYEQRLNQLIYEVYTLTPDEIAYVELFFSQRS